MGTFILAMLGTIIVFFSLYFFLPKKGENVEHQPQTPVVTTARTAQAGTQAQPVVATPAAKSMTARTAIWSIVGLVVVVAIALTIFGDSSGESRPKSKPKPEWGNTETLNISGTPIRVAWPQGATRVSLEPISPILPDPSSQSARRYYIVRSGNRSFTVSGREEEDFRPIIGKPLTLTSVDGRPMSIDIKFGR